MDVNIMSEFSQKPLFFLSVFNGVAHSIDLFSTEAVQIDRH